MKCHLNLNLFLKVLKNLTACSVPFKVFICFLHFMHFIVKIEFTEFNEFNDDFIEFTDNLIESIKASYLIISCLNFILLYLLLDLWRIYQISCDDD